MTFASSLLCPTAGSLRPVEDADEEIFHLFTGLTEQGKHGLGHTTIHNDRISIRVDLDLGLEAGSEAGANSVSKPAIKRFRSHQEVPQNIFRFPSGLVTISPADEEDTETVKTTSEKPKKRDARSQQHQQLKHSRKSPASSNGSGQRPRVSDPVDPIHIILRQDHTSFRTVAGNTGSVAWRSSFALATLLLRDVHYASQGRHDQASLLNGKGLFDKALTSTASRNTRPYTILELGAGTGVLSSVFLTHPAFSAPVSGLTAQLRWIATDQGEVFELLKRNVETTRSRLYGSASTPSHPSDKRIALSAHELDWQSVLELAHRGDASSRRQLDKLRLEIMAPELHHDPEFDTSPVGASRLSLDCGEAEDGWPDLILAVDCIFNPALFDALLATFALFASGRPDTQLLVVSELREVDMMRSFLEAWSQSGTGLSSARTKQHGLNVSWSIHGWEPGKAPDGDEKEEDLGRHGLGTGFVVWLARSQCCTSSTV